MSFFLGVERAFSVRSSSCRAERSAQNPISVRGCTALASRARRRADGLHANVRGGKGYRKVRGYLLGPRPCAIRRAGETAVAVEASEAVPGHADYSTTPDKWENLRSTYRGDVWLSVREML